MTVKERWDDKLFSKSADSQIKQFIMFYDIDTFLSSVILRRCSDVINKNNFFCQVWIVERGSMGLRDLQWAMERKRGRGLLAAETEPRPRAEIRPPAGLREGGRPPLHVRREQEWQRQQNTDLDSVLVMEIRKRQFREKSSDPLAALVFLQTEVSSEDKEEQREFQTLAHEE